MKKVLQESLWGPEEFDISVDFDTGAGVHVPEIRKEMQYFRNNLQFSDILEFIIFDNGRCSVQGIDIIHSDDNNFHLRHDDNEIAAVPGKIDYKPTYKIGERLPDPYKPPLFGITCLGPSHGFDPEENTSGFIVWINHHGIMVDPPVNSTEWLEDSNVSPKLIDSVILTHCHADHDAGTFQKILEEEKITVYATETVMMSFLRKYGALSNVDTSFLMKLFHFHPIKIGQPLFIHGAKFDMFYTLHSIPTVGFRMEFQNQTFVYTSDHNNDPALHRKLLDENIISADRHNSLKNFPWDSKIIYHEAGVPPLHTPVSYLNSLEEELQKKIVVYHIATKDFPEKTSLTLAKFGMENTIYFKTQSPPFEEAYQILTLLKSMEIFRDIDIGKVQQFLTIVEKEEYKKGETIIYRDTPGDKFYIIYSGNVSVDSGGLEKRKIYGTYEYFGEVAVLTGQARAADVVAETDLVVYTIRRDQFLNFIVGTEFEKTLKRLAKIRSSETWNLLSASRFFQSLTSSQKTWLESIFLPVKKTGSGILQKEGTSIECIYIIQSGEVEVTEKGKKIAVLKKGDFIGAIDRMHKGEPSGYTYTYNGPISLYAMKKDDILKFIENNPGQLMKIVHDF
jgi:CRP-like cAMP-binding protein/phosphoribosyl 1,2-cyclic phosphodiesterase